jgi:hypothetical protein
VLRENVRSSRCSFDTKKISGRKVRRRVCREKNENRVNVTDIESIRYLRRKKGVKKKKENVKKINIYPFPFSSQIVYEWEEGRSE